jgi:type I restriction enzyme S subunit
MRQIDEYSHGIVKDRNRLYWEDFKRMPSPCPPRDEQVQISDTIDRVTQNLTDAMCRTKDEIELLREYHTRLIADVVTGKLDVRVAAARLPDEADELYPIVETDTSIEWEEDADVVETAAVRAHEAKD